MNDMPSEVRDLEPVESPEEPAPEEPSRALVPGEVHVEVPPAYESRWQDEWEALHPALRGALACWPMILVFAIFSFGSLGCLAPFLYPLQLIVYGSAGALAVHWARRESRADTAFALGLLAGITLAGLDILTYFVMSVLLGAATGGLGLGALCIMVACAPLDATISTLVGGLGGIIYDSMIAQR